MTETDQKQKEWEIRTYNLYIQLGKYILLGLTGLGLFIFALGFIKGV